MTEITPSGGVALRPVAAAGSARTRSAAFAIAGIAAAKLAIQCAGITRYGFFRDELYYMACGRHLAWGYIDQPPLIPFVAWISAHAFGSSIIALRLWPICAGAALVVLMGMFARELGGGPFAQSLAAVALLFAPAFLAFDSFFSMNAFEPLFWLACAWIAVRIARGASPKWWLAFGLIAGIGLENKHTMLVFGFALVAGLLLSGERRLFRSKWIWIGALAALALFLPNLIWEARHGWPQITVVRNAQRFKNVRIGALRFMGDEILFLHPLTLPLWIGGLAWYFRARRAQGVRFLGWAYVILLGIFIGLDGKSYYLLPAYPMLLAAGGVAFEEWAAVPKRQWLRTAFPAALVAAGLFTVPFGAPVLSLEGFLRYSHALPYARAVKTERDATAAIPQLYADMTGWPQMAEGIAGVYRALPPEERAGCAIIAGNYGEAGAIDYYGPSLGLPPAISGHNSYFDWGTRGYSGACVILFGERAAEHAKLFEESRLVGVIKNRYGMPIEQNVRVYLCHKPREPLAALWPDFKMII